MKERYPECYWPEIKAIGNLLRHEYNRVDDLVLWKIARDYFPALRRVINDMLTQSD